MNCNNQINLLKRWCEEKSNIYYEHYHTSGISNIRYFTTSEIAFKLSMLIDHDFENNEDFQSHIKNLLDIHFDYSLKNPINTTAKYMIEKIQNDFLEYANQIIYTENDDTPNNSIYERVIINEEAAEIISQINQHWGYENDSYWFPLMGEEPQKVSDKFFIMKKYLTPHWETIKSHIFHHNSHIYSYGESAYDLEFCIETTDIDNITLEEWSYTDKDFSWFIYFSHEDTVSFAGTIVPVIKEILISEKTHWNCFEYPDN